MSNSLIAKQALYDFGELDEDRMLDFLEHMDSCTIKQLIASPKDIELRADGVLAINGYRLAPLAFKQLCRYVAKGLYGLVADIGAVIGNARSLDAYTSPALAAEIINKLVKLRFNVPDGISTKALILNSETKTVDGIVGARYRYAPSYQLYDSVKEMIDGKSLVFSQATLSGRRFAATFCTEGGWQLRSGGTMQATLYVTNSEAGEAGIHAGAGYLIENAYLLGTLHHTAHSDKDFETRLNSLIAYALSENSARVAEYARREARLAEPLNFVHEMKIDGKRRHEITKQIGKYVGKTTAEYVVRKALFQGAGGTIIPARVAIEDVATRTKRDLALTLARHGDEHYHTLRELCQRAAFVFMS